MKKTTINGRKAGIGKAARAAGILALTLVLGACSSKSDVEETQSTTIATETTTDSGTEEVKTTEAVVTTQAASDVTTVEATEAGTEEGTEAGTEAVQPTLADRSEHVVKLDSIQVADYIDLSKVKELKVKAEDVKVKEESIRDAVSDGLVYEFGFALEEKNRPVQIGDTVNIDYEGSVDGVKFDGGTAAGQDLVIGSGKYIPGFEEGIVGKMTGDEFDLPVTFPENYGSADLDGKDAVFKIKVNKILALPEEVSDAEIKEKSGGRYETYQAYYDSIADEVNKENHREVLFNKIMDAVEVKAEHEGLINEFVQLQLLSLDQTCQMYGVDRKAFLDTYGYTEEDYTNLLKEEGKEYSKQKLAILGICHDNGYEIKEDEVDAYKKKLAADYGFENTEELMTLTTAEELKFQMLYEKFIEYIDNYKLED